MVRDKVGGSIAQTVSMMVDREIGRPRWRKKSSAKSNSFLRQASTAQFKYEGAQPASFALGLGRIRPAQQHQNPGDQIPAPYRPKQVVNGTCYQAGKDVFFIKRSGNTHNRHARRQMCTHGLDQLRLVLCVLQIHD